MLSGVPGSFRGQVDAGPTPAPNRVAGPSNNARCQEQRLRGSCVTGTFPGRKPAFVPGVSGWGQAGALKEQGGIAVREVTRLHPSPPRTANSRPRDPGLFRLPGPNGAIEGGDNCKPVATASTFPAAPGPAAPTGHHHRLPRLLHGWMLSLVSWRWGLERTPTPEPAPARWALKPTWSHAPPQAPTGPGHLPWSACLATPILSQDPPPTCF